MSDDWEDALGAVTWKPLTGDGEQAVFVPAGGPLLVEDLEGDDLLPAVVFRWSTAGLPRSREARLVLLAGQREETLVLYDAGGSADGAGSLTCLARLGSPAAFAPCFYTLVAGNGAAYGCELFRSLPTLTTNQRPELLPEATVHDAYRAFLDGPAAEMMHDPWRQLQRRLKKMQSPSGIQLGKAHGGRQREREEAITAGEKARILQKYLDLTYKELRSQR